MRKRFLGTLAAISAFGAVNLLVFSSIHSWNSRQVEADNADIIAHNLIMKRIRVEAQQALAIPDDKELIQRATFKANYDRSQHLINTEHDPVVKAHRIFAQQSARQSASGAQSTSHHDPTTLSHPGIGKGKRVSQEEINQRIAAQRISTKPECDQTTRGIELAKDSVLITAPGLEFGFDLNPSEFKNGACVISNLSQGDYILTVTSAAGGDVLINGNPSKVNTPLAVKEGMIIQTAGDAKVTIKGGTLPEPIAPNSNQ